MRWALHSHVRVDRVACPCFTDDRQDPSQEFLPFDSSCIPCRLEVAKSGR